MRLFILNTGSFFANDDLKNRCLISFAVYCDIIWYNVNSVTHGPPSMSVQDIVRKAGEKERDHWTAQISKSLTSRAVVYFV